MSADGRTQISLSLDLRRGRYWMVGGAIAGERSRDLSTHCLDRAGAITWLRRCLGSLGLQFSVARAVRPGWNKIVPTKEQWVARAKSGDQVVFVWTDCTTEAECQEWLTCFYDGLLKSSRGGCQDEKLVKRI
jgi:hypothetical protein